MSKSEAPTVAQWLMLWDLIRDLVDGRFHHIVAACDLGGHTPSEISDAVQSYPGKMTMPPYTFMEKVEWTSNFVDHSIEGQFLAPMWYDDEESDMILDAKYSEESGVCKVRFWSLHVM